MCLQLRKSFVGPGTAIKFLLSWNSCRFRPVLAVLFSDTPCTCDTNHCRLCTSNTRNQHNTQLDYILLNRILFHHFVDAEACNQLGLGSDRKAVVTKLRLPPALWNWNSPLRATPSIITKTTSTTNRKRTPWTHVDQHECKH